ncbi:hypothetical protein [Anatilimnocola floriformis]|uniref:hypothetical protein n=1 Tax=Anatilimnocola floriformis TaxID=2948575 RepID=UPI0020C3C3CF|nr:hypothetical protein [Anatilimnocola floriformis]
MPAQVRVACNLVLGLSLALILPPLGHAADPFAPANPTQQVAEERARQQQAREAMTLLTFEQALRMPIKGELDGVELRDLILWLADVTEIQIQIDSPALQELKVEPSQEIKLTIGDKPLPAWKVLVLALQKVNPKLVAVPRNEMLVVTSEARSHVTNVYDVRDILDASTKGKLSRDEAGAALVKHILGTIAADSWKEKGGNGQATIYRDLLVVEQSARVHWLIREDLLAVRNRQGAEDPLTKETVMIAGPSERAQDLVRRNDRNGDGFLQYEECPAAAQPDFEKFDQDQDRKLSAAEIDRLIRAKIRQRVQEQAP